MAGYSKTPLVKKLGINENAHVVILNAPENYHKLLEDLPPGVTFGKTLETNESFIHFFTTSSQEVEHEFPNLKASLKRDGTLWISWPKGSSKISSNLNENIIRAIGLANGLVDVKVAAIDEDWSGLKFVYRLKDR